MKANMNMSNGVRVEPEDINYNVDILCGKNKDCLGAPGSVRFRAIIDEYAESYQKAPSKYDKMTITKNIYEFVSQSSRFLKFNENLGYWEEISPMAARDKVGHALRFANRRTTNPRKSPVFHLKQGAFSLTRSSLEEDSCTWATSSSSSNSTDRNSDTTDSALDALEKSIYGMDSFVAQFQNTQTSTAEPQEACQTLLQFLSMENEQEIPHQAPSADELKVVFDEFLSEDRFASMKDDLLQMVESMSMSGQQQGSTSLMMEAMQMQLVEPCLDSSKHSLASLMMEPLGDWQD